MTLVVHPSSRPNNKKTINVIAGRVPAIVEAGFAGYENIITEYTQDITNAISKTAIEIVSNEVKRKAFGYIDYASRKRKYSNRGYTSRSSIRPTYRRRKYRQYN